MRTRTDAIDFVIAGTQKGGTTALDRYLRKHPGIAMASRKEIHFFDDEENFQIQPVDYTTYYANFVARSPARLRGESTPIYMYWKAVAPRMARYNPALKVIIVLRNPITRAFSHWNMERTIKGREALPFLDALETEPERTRQALPLQLRHASYVDRGFYTRQLRWLWQHFPPTQTLVLRSEDLKASTGKTMKRITEFRQLAPIPHFVPKLTQAKYERAMTPVERQYLAGIFAEEIRELEQLLGWDCSGWLA